MAWIEKRRQQHRVYERAITGRKTYEPFATRADADLFVDLLKHVDWDTAIAFVRQQGVPATPPAVPLVVSARGSGQAPLSTVPAIPVVGTSRMHLPAPPELKAAGITVGELCRRHINALTGIEEDTREQYLSNIRDYVDPFFGDLDAGWVIAKPHPDAERTAALAVTDWRVWLQAQPKLTRKGPHATRKLAGKTVHNIMGIVSSAYAAAQAEDFRRLVDRNPFRGSARGARAQDVVERVFLSRAQFAAVHAAIDEHFQLLLLFLVLTGLRWGEAAGLRVRDVCLEPESGRAYLEVRVALKLVRGGGTMLGRLKSAKARRRLTIPAVLIPGLRAAIAGKAPDDVVFTSKEGCRLRHSNFHRRLARAIIVANAAGAEVPYFTAHSFRHTCAGWLLSAGRTLYQVSKQLGHESEQTTGRYYGHLDTTAVDDNADTIEGYLAEDWQPASFVDVDVALTMADQSLAELDLHELDGADETDRKAA
jgi:integrase